MRRRLTSLTLLFTLLTLTAPALAWDWPGKLQQATAGLRSSNPQERIAALQRLAALDPQQSAAPLRAALDDPDPDVQRVAIDALRVQGVRDAAPLLLPLLSAPDAPLRADAARALGALGGPESLDGLIRALGDAAPEVREAAARALGQLGLSGGLQAIVACLQDPEARVVVAAMEVLGESGDSAAVFALLEKTRDPNVRIQLQAITALGRLGDPRAARPLAGMLAHESREVRGVAVDALGELGWRDATPLLLHLLAASYNTELGPRIIAALGRTGDPQSVAPLLELLQREPLAASAAAALKRLGPPALEPLVRLLRAGGDEEAARHALDVLAWSGAPAQGASPEQRRMVADALLDELGRRRLPRRPLLLALAATRDPRAAEPLLAEILLPDPEVVVVAPGPRGNDTSRASLLLALASLDDLRVVAPIVELYPSLSPPEREAALLLFAALRSEEAVPLLQRGLASGEAEEPLWAARALGAVGSGEAARWLLAALQRDLPPPLTLEVIYALGRCRDAESLQALRLAALEGPEPGRLAALRALGDRLHERPDPALQRRLIDLLLAAPRSPLALAAADALAASPLASADLERLLAAFPEGTPALRAKLLQRFGEAGAPQALPRTLEATESPAAALRAEAAWTLGLLGDPEATPRLLALLDDPEWPVAINAAAALARLGDPQALAGVQARLGTARGPLRANLLLAAARLGAPPTPERARLEARRADSAPVEASLYHLLAASAGEGAPEVLQAALLRAADPAAQATLRGLLGLEAPSPGAAWSRFVFTDARGPMRAQRALVLLPDGLLLGRVSDAQGELYVSHPGGGVCHLFPLDEVFSVDP